MKTTIGWMLLTLPLSGWAAVSPVADAVMNGDAATLQALLKQKADVNASQADGATAIHWAAYHDDLETASRLIAAGANVKTANREGATALQLASLTGHAAPLMFAARNGNLAAIQILLDHLADVNAKENLRGTTALMWAAEQGHAQAAKLLIDYKADISAASNPDTKGGTAYLAPPIQSRLRSERGPGGRARTLPLGVKSGGDPADDFLAAADAAAAAAAFGRQRNAEGGGLTPLVFASRQGDLETVKVLVEAKADVNQTTHYGWTPLLTATQNRNYRIGRYLLEHGADPNIANKGGWNPLYIATDNRNIEGGDYPVRAPDIDHLEYIKLLLDHGANVNARVCGIQSTDKVCKGDSTETRTIFTMQWLYEDGATPFWRAAQSGDVTLMKLLLEKGADPKIRTAHDVSALAVAAGIGWVEGITFEWSEKDNLEAVRMCLDAGIDPNVADDEGRTALHGAAHKGRNEVVKLLVEHGAKLDARDLGSRDTVNGAMLGVTWMPLHYAQGLVRVGVQSAIPHPETEALIRQLMKDKGLPIPPDITSSICLTKGVNGCQ